MQLFVQMYNHDAELPIDQGSLASIGLLLDLARNELDTVQSLLASKLNESATASPSNLTFRKKLVTQRKNLKEDAMVNRKQKILNQMLKNSLINVSTVSPVFDGNNML